MKIQTALERPGRSASFTVRRNFNQDGAKVKVRFWGVRGSIPAPLSSLQVKAKITAVVQRIGVNDLASPDARERFISKLPDWIFGTTGGNTPCLELRGSDGTEIILDAGTGIRCLGRAPDLPKSKHFHLFFSHFHWDHIQGLPFFDPVYDNDTTFDVYSALENARDLLVAQQENPYFPAHFSALTPHFTFHTVKSGAPFAVGGFTVNSCSMSHPGGSQSFAFIENGRKFVYATDVELSQRDFASTPEHESVFRNADCIVLDSQYTVEEAHRKVNWGHSAFCNAVDFAVNWGIKKMFLFHHEPAYDDKKLNSILNSARWYAQYIIHSDIEIFLAVENREIEI